MKPSDYQVARVCKTCADAYEVKYKALVRDGRFEVLAAFQQDALELHEAWLASLEQTKPKVRRCAACRYNTSDGCAAEFEHLEPDEDCALDELVEQLAGGMLDDPVEARAWLVAWANRRAANVVRFLVEPMIEIANYEPDAEGGWQAAYRSMRFVAAQALKTAGIKAEG